jgi:hypothetical protein
MSKRIRPYGEEEKQYMRDYYQRNKERIKARVKNHYEATRPAQIAYRRKYYKENKEVLLVSMAKYRDAHKNDPVFINSRRAAKNKYEVALKAEVFSAYGDKCTCCGETEPRFLTIDHIHGDGKQHRAEVGIRGVYKSIRDQGFPKDKYQLLCCNCNWAKGIFGICPHESKRLQKKISIVEDDGLRAIAG